MGVFKVFMSQWHVFSQLYFFLTLWCNLFFFSLICAFTNGQMKEAQNNENYISKAKLKPP